MAEAPWAGQMGQMIVRGSRVHHEAVFFHRASRTLIFADLMEDFEPANLPWLMRLLPHGRSFDRDSVAELRRAFRFVL